MVALLVLEYSVFLGGGDRLLLLLLPFDEETVELLFFFASSASSAGAKDFTIAFKVSLSAIEESSAVEKIRTCIGTKGGSNKNSKISNSTALKDLT